MIPSGSSLAPASLTLRAMGQQVAPATGGGFSVGVSPTAPTLTIATDAGGTGILAALLDPAGGTQNISAHSTAVALSWCVMGGMFLPAGTKSEVLGMLNSDPRMDTIGAVIAQRVAADPHAIFNGDAQIAAALTSALEGIVPGPSAPRPGLLRSDIPLVEITPPTDQGGISVRPDGTSAAVNFANSYRRPVKVYVYEVETSTSGVATPIVPARRTAGPLLLDEPLSLTPTGGLLAFLTSPKPFDPALLGPVPVPLDGASDKTTYEVVAIGPSATGVIPPFFGAARYANEVAGWNTEIEAMFARTYFIDLTYALMLELSGFASLLPTSPSLVQVAEQTKGAVGLPFGSSGGGPRVPESPGTLLNTAKALADSFGTPETLPDSYRTSAPSLLDSVGAAALARLNRIDWQASLRTGTNFVAKLASPFSGAKANGALSRLFGNLASADRGALWTVVVSRASATILPPSPATSAGTPITLTVELSSDLVGTYEYEWSQTAGNAAELGATDATPGVSITTRQSSVTLTTIEQQVDPVTVTVRVIDVSQPGRRLQVTTATTTVRILRKATISPSPKVLFPNDVQTFTVSVEGTLPPGVRYIWNVVGESGTIGSIGQVSTTVPSIQYTALKQGNDTLKVQVADANQVVIAVGEATINVDPSNFIDFTISGAWDPEKTPANGRYFYGDLEAARVASPVPGLDWLAITFNVAPDQTIGVLLSVFVPAATRFTTGQTFTKINGPGAPPPGTFQLTLSADQNDVENSYQWAPVGAGTLEMTLVQQNQEGKWVGRMSFSIDNGSGTIIGTCVATWS